MGAINLRDFGADIFECPACGASLLVRLGRDETLVRCVKCRGTPIHLSMIEAILQLGFGRHRDVCELSSRGALVDFLKRSFHRVSTSEFFDGIELGSSIGEVRCEDVMSLTYPDREFDLFTCTEVFEHVADDLAGFREV